MNRLGSRTAAWGLACGVLVVSAALAAAGCDNGDAAVASVAAASGSGGRPAGNRVKPPDRVGERPDVNYLGRANRETMTEALAGLEPLSAGQRRVVQGALHHRGLQMVGPANPPVTREQMLGLKMESPLKGPLTREQVVACVESHASDKGAATFKFRNGNVLVVKADRAIFNENYSFEGTKPLPPPGRLNESQLEDVFRYIGARFSVDLNEAQRATLREKLTTAGAVLDEAEQFLLGESSVVERGRNLPSGGARLEFFNGAVLELSADGAVTGEYLPWQGA